jgi:hypothetical protein
LQKSRRFSWVIILIVTILILPLAGIGGALLLENQDLFCAACHTEPESTYYQQSIQANPGTLAAYHTQKKIGCIDCHSGAGAFGRLEGLEQGTHDLIAFIGGAYRRPSVTTNPLGDPGCVKCHERITSNSSKSVAMNGHYHTFLPVWQSMEKQTAARCGSCHTSHTKGLEGLAFMSQGKVAQLCDNCHTALSGKIKK